MKLRHIHVLSAAMLFGIGAAQAQYTDDKIKIGVLTDMSGIYSENSGKGSVEAAKLAIEEFGGKVNGKAIELVIGDHQNKADIGVSIANKWFDVEQVDAVADLVNSAVALGVQDVAKRKEKITLISGGGTFDLTGKACSPTGAHWTYDTWSLGAGIAEALPQLGKKWYFITADYAFGHALEKGITNFVTKAGGEVGGSVKHPFNTADFSSYLLQAAAAKPDVIAFANAGDDLNNAVKQANEFGLNQKGIKMATMSMDVDNIHGLGLPAAQGAMYVVGFYADLDDDTRAFAKRYRDRMGRSPGFIPAGVYSAVRHYLKAIEASGTDDAKKVIAKMREMPINDGFAKGGKLREDGRMVHDMYLLQVKAPNESKGAWDYLKLVKVIPGNAAFRPMNPEECTYLKK
jgi:branched-chain amino acid transport system substrate-binding protein